MSAMLQALYTSIAVYVQGMRNMFDLLSTEELTKQTLDVVFVVVEVVVVDLRWFNQMEFQSNSMSA